MKPEHRLRSTADFHRVRRDGRSVAGPGLVLYYSARDDGGCPRFGFVVTRRIGGAVVRNRVRRLLREAVRSLLPRLRAPVDVVVVAREPIREAGFVDVVGAVTESVARAGLLDAPNPDVGTEGHLE